MWIVIVPAGGLGPVAPRIVERGAKGNMSPKDDKPITPKGTFQKQWQKALIEDIERITKRNA